MPCFSISDSKRACGPLALLILWIVLAAAALPNVIVEHHPDGSVKSETPLDDFGLPNGLRREFSPEGKLIAERTYEHGELNGPSRLFHPDGSLKTEWHYKNGKRHGLSVGYYPDGTVKDKGLYQEDKLEGKVYLYYPNGKLKAELQFKKDRQDGLSQTYYENGRVKQRFVYDKGRLVRLQNYEPNGALLNEQDYDSRTPGR